MSDIGKMMDEDYGYFEDNEFVLVPQGIYPAHIVDLEVTENKVFNSFSVEGAKHCADIYNLRFSIAEEAENLEIPTSSGESINGSTLVSQVVRGKGIMMFKDHESEEVIPNPKGNWAYKNLVELCGIELEEKKIDDNKGGTKTVKSLPKLRRSDVCGKPVFITVAHREYEDKIYANAVKITRWEGGKEIEVADSDLPF